MAGAVGQRDMFQRIGELEQANRELGEALRVAHAKLDAAADSKDLGGIISTIRKTATAMSALIFGTPYTAAWAVVNAAWNMASVASRIDAGIRYRDIQAVMEKRPELTREQAEGWVKKEKELTQELRQLSDTWYYYENGCDCDESCICSGSPEMHRSRIVEIITELSPGCDAEAFWNEQNRLAEDHAKIMGLYDYD